MSNPPVERSAPTRPFSRPLFLLAAAVALLLAAGCAGGAATTPSSNDGGAATTPDGDGSERYVRRVAPFPVQGAGSEAQDHPFLGGFNIPRPQIVDVDGDGDQDLFVQEETNRLIFFENTAAPDAPAELVWRSSKYKGLDVGEWYRFVDLTGGPAVDLLAEQPYSYLRYYRNTDDDEAGEAQFELAKDTMRTVEGEPLFSDRQNIPNVADVDCDGRPDLFVGRLDGTITRYEAARKTRGAAQEDGLPRFRLVTDRFAGIQIVGQGAQPGQLPPRPGQQTGPLGGSGSAKHGANTMAFADGDGDGDPDLLWGDYFEKGLLILENRGGCETLNFSNEPKPFPPQDPLKSSGYNAPAIGDLTGDGRPDMLVGVIGGAYNPQRTTAANLYFYERGAGGEYQKRTERFLSMIDVGAESAPAFGDLDGDDDLDLLIGNKAAPRSNAKGQLLRYENTGAPSGPRLRLADTLSLAPGAYNRAPALVDLDADGDLDLVTGTWREGLLLYENTGADTGAQFAEKGTSLLELKRSSRAVPAFADLDGDDDLDLVVGESDGSLTAFRNEGTAQEPQFAPAPGWLQDVTVDRRSAPALRDVDGDGVVDLLVGSEADGLVFFRNEGTAQEPQFTRVGGNSNAPRPFSMYAPALAVPAFADLDGDGDDDLFTGAGRGGLFFYEDGR